MPLTDCPGRWLKAGKEKAPLNFRSTGAPTFQLAIERLAPKLRGVKGMTRNLLILAVTVVIAVTVLVFARMERGSLCEMRLHVGSVEFAALLNYENRS